MVCKSDPDKVRAVILLKDSKIQNKITLDLNWSVSQLEVELKELFAKIDDSERYPDEFTMKLILWNEESQEEINDDNINNEIFCNMIGRCDLKKLRDIEVEYADSLKEKGLPTDKWAILISPVKAVQVRLAHRNRNMESYEKELRLSRFNLPHFKKFSKCSKENSLGEFLNSKNNYRGLVNQAMTCYLNSLLQALYMTPEFRNALYKWEYIDSPDNDETMSIPFQLQKLFLNLQTAEKDAIETTSLTKSFGWDSSEVWQQHDIQELCRVMFDALEQKFKNTEQANLINQLYEGKMIDYVKCLECNTEKTREDKFLDIPLPVRPFGSNIAYKSIEEALNAFVKYELLEGNNQYHCEKCDKKCDAHKGLKFTKFPYLVTIHLKRFDFDCHSFHRIKLNDRVTFPEELDLNPFIDTADSLSNEEMKCENKVKIDNGTVEDECCSSCDGNIIKNDQLNEDHIEEQGINETNDNRNDTEPKGPYIYELFAIMIHSGSASGGHYYAYIKDFTTHEWFCFNDQCVTKITKDDIIKTYGGGPARTTYYSAYNTSTNAYMLMYRQIDPQVNALPMQQENFPEHIKKLLPKLKEENLTVNCPPPQRQLISITIYCQIPTKNVMEEMKVQCRDTWTWNEVLHTAYKGFHLEQTVKVDRSSIKLHEYDESNKCPSGNILNPQNVVDSSVTSVILVLPQLLKQQTGKMHIINIDVDAGKCANVIKPKFVFSNITVGELRGDLAKDYNLDPEKMELVGIIDDNLEQLKDNVQVQSLTESNIFIGNKLDPNPSNTDFHTSKLYELCHNYRKLFYVKISVPIVDEVTLIEFNIRPLWGMALKSDERKEDIDTECNETSKECSQSEIMKEPKDEVIANCSSSTLQLAETDGRNTPEYINYQDSNVSDSDKSLDADSSKEDKDNQVYEIIKETDKYLHTTKFGLWMTQKFDSCYEYLKVLEPFIGIRSTYFKVKRFRTKPGKSFEFILKRTMNCYEFKAKVYLFNQDQNSKEMFVIEPLFDIIVNLYMTGNALKNNILRLLELKFSRSVSKEHCRLWAKNVGRPVIILNNTELFNYFPKDAENSDSVKEIYLQQSFCTVYDVDNPNQTVLYIRQFLPQVKEFLTVQELLVDINDQEIEKKIAESLRIPHQNLQMLFFSELKTKVVSLLPYDKIDVIPLKVIYAVHKSLLPWRNSLKPLPEDIGDIIICRDDQDQYPDEFSDHEDSDEIRRKNIFKEYSSEYHPVSDKEIRIRHSQHAVSRRERGIKIHVSPDK